VGKRYLLTGYAHGDGTDSPYIRDGSITLASGLTGSTSWQRFNIDFISQGTSIQLFKLGAGYVEFDDVSVQLLEETQTTDSSGHGRNFLLGDGTTSTTFPTFLNNRNGYSLDGTTDYFSCVNATGIYGNAEQSIVLGFVPGFDVEDGAQSYLLDSTVGKRVAILKAATNSLVFHINNVTIDDIALAVWVDYWRDHGRNVLVFSGTSGNSNAWLNGYQIMSSDTTAWGASIDPTEIYLGCFSAISFKYKGDIFHFSAYPFMLSSIQTRDITTRILRGA